jgi:SagB-type dehydrogenase family enzyme
MESVARIALANIVFLNVSLSTLGANQLDLPKPDLRGMALEEAIAKRRSVRSYSDEAIGLSELSQILAAAQGVTGRVGSLSLRSAPSAGATYPMETYVFVNRVEGLGQGVYRYRPDAHALELVKAGAYGDSLSYACHRQAMPAEAAASVVLTAVPKRTTDRYGRRGLNYIYMEAGHIAQNICLQCTSLGLGAVPIGAFEDAELDRLVDADGEHEMSIYVIAFGKIPESRGEDN